MKKIMAAVLCLLLCGCGTLRADPQARLNERIVQAQSWMVAKPNYTKRYYSYYGGPDLGRLGSDMTSNRFSSGGIQFVMNLDVSGIINEKYYDEIKGTQLKPDPSRIIASSKGSYEDTQGNEYPFEVSVCGIGSDYAVLLHAGYLDFCAVCDLFSTADIAREMLLLARSVRISREEVLKDFTILESISYEGEKIKLFDDMAPESGSIEELFVDTNIAGDGTGIDFENFIDDGQEYHGQIETDDMPIDE